MAKQLEKYQQIERSIITTYRKGIWSPFVLAVKKYQLVQAGDKIAVCIGRWSRCIPDPGSIPKGVFHK